MIPPADLAPAVWSFGIASAVLSVFAIHLALSWRGGIRALALLAAVGLGVAWAGVGLAFAIWEAQSLWVVWRCVDVLQTSCWIAFLLVLLEGRLALGATNWFRPPASIVLLAAVLGAAGLELIAPALLPGTASAADETVRLGLSISLGLAVVGLVGVEQLLRSTPPQQRWNIKPLCIGLGGVFGFQLFMNSEGVLFGALDPSVWAAYGAVQACVIPFVAVATGRNRDWTLDISISRQAVFHSTALLVAGLYLLAVGGVGYYVRYLGGTWGGAIRIAVLFAAIVVLAILGTSGTVRSKLRVFVNKHFFAFRYDYREEWLRFTDRLAVSAGPGVYEQVIRALADLVESPGGALWLKRGGAIRQVARWNSPEIAAVEPCDGALAAFLARTGWVVDIRELRESAERYDGLALPTWLAGGSDAWLVVPLVAGGDLIGFGVLAEPRVAVEVNWEVRDLLKTAGRQAASYLGQIEASEALIEAEKFAAFNRMSAFVVHDLKNLVAQLSLILKNVERHRNNPEFQRDMMETVRHVSDRMTRLLAHLRAESKPVEWTRGIDLGAIAQRVAQSRDEPQVAVRTEIEDRVLALGHDDRLEHVVGHLVQNAIEATAPPGIVLIRVFEQGGQAVVEIADEGVGMTPAFVRSRLFRPFQTTKRDGMGIGAFESHQYVTGIGGQIVVDTRPGQGTRVQVRLLRSDVAASTHTDLREVA